MEIAIGSLLTLLILAVLGVIQNDIKKIKRDIEQIKKKG